MDCEKFTSELRHLSNSVPFHVLRKTTRYAKLFLQGCSIIGFVIIYLILSIPVFIYRLLIVHLVAPFFRQTIGKPVSPISNAYITDLYNNSRSPRSSIVVEMVLEGKLSLDAVIEIFKKGLLDVALENGELVYPELRQFAEPWMGFLFWKHDKDFSLRNHINLHTLRKRGTEFDSEKYTCQLMEELLNKRFPNKRSPWELHVVHNYKMANTAGSSTLVVFRFQHGIADGYSILYALVEGLGGVSLAKMSLTQPKRQSNEFQKISRLDKLVLVTSQGIQFIKNVLYEMQFYAGLRYRPQSPWFITDDKKHWKQIYTRSPLIPIDKLKETKDRLGVSFTGLVLAAVSASVSKHLEDKNYPGNAIRSLPTFSTIPLPGHPKGLHNHHAGVAFDIPAKVGLTPMARLLECEKYLNIAKQSRLLFVAVVVWRLLGCQLAALNARIFRNPLVPAFLSNFPGPTFPLRVHGRKVYSTSFAVGAGSGVAGIGFMILSYNDKVRVALTAERATMTRPELNQMLDRILQEFNTLHKLSCTPNLKQFTK